jgi:hypothetical protein
MVTVQKVKFGYFRLLHGGHTQAKRNDDGSIVPRVADDGTVITDGRGKARPLIEKFRADRINNVFPVIKSLVDLTELFGYEKFQRLTPQEVALLVTEDEAEQELDLTGMTLPQLKRFAREMDIEIPDDVVGKEQVRNYIQSEIDSR